MSGAEVVLPHGTTFVAVTKIPALLALAKYPVPANGKTLRSICKMPIFVEPDKQPISDSVPVEPAVEPVTESDLVKLAAIWSALPSFKLGLDEAGWSPYGEACAAADPFPGWTIHPEWNDAGHVVAIVRMRAAEVYEAALPKDIENGILVAVDSLTGRVVERDDLTGRSTTALRGAIVRLKALEDYSALFGVSVRVAADPAAVIVRTTNKSTPPMGKTALPWWQASGDFMGMAQSVGESLRRRQERTSNSLIAKGLAKRINDDESRRGSNRAIDADTVRGALTGWKFRPE